MSRDLLIVASNCLAYSIGSIPFTFLGIQVGANLRTKSSWNHVVDKIKKRLSKWHRKQMSIDAGVVVLNAVLTNLFVFHFPFTKPLKG